MNKSKFKADEKVKVRTKFLNCQDYFWLPGEVLYFWESASKEGYSVILWAGAIHKVPTKDIYKLDDEDVL